MTATPDDTRIALISKDISYIQRDIADINVGIKALDGVYATQESVSDLEKQISTMAQTVEKINNRQTGVQKYIPHIVTSSLTGVLVFLILFFLNNVK